ncbi:Limb region 1 -like protein [Saguinus oedipus]|uniref:Limb region 1 -like protein n=1 Tax=Saguinus oedipus TaxID=9490 RepID=A0ABQ9V152_SAGOE|nr:Limb region 1 -like protein [Saguinus oedipus]
MFSVTGKLLVKPRLLEDLEEQLYCSAFEEAALTRRICTSHPYTEKRRKASAWQRNLGYPLAMLCLLVLTVGIPALEVGSGPSVLEAFSGRGEAMWGPGYHQ